MKKKNVSKFDEDFIKNHDEDSNKGYILEVNNEYPKHLVNLHSDSPFLAERMKIKKNYAIHIRALKQALNHGLMLNSTQSNPV